MRLRRVTPISVALALTAAALIAAAWTMRSTVDRGFGAVRDGEAVAIAHAVRADLSEVAPLRGGTPTDDELAAIVRDHAADGLRYIAILTASGQSVVASGRAVGIPALVRMRSHIATVGDRVRIEMRLGRRAYGERGAVLALELEPPGAQALQRASARLLAIGGIASLTLLSVAFGLIRRELAARAGAEARERQKRLASLGEMSAVLAHEIRNPLASLKGNAQLLAASLTAADSERTKARAQRVVDEATRIEQLTADLLAFIGTGELARAEVDVAALLHEAASTAGPDVRDVRVSCDSDLQWSLDRSRMRSALANLIENAVQAGTPVEVTAKISGDRLLVQISDRGAGVPAEDRARVFEPFYTTKTQGTGLGLAVTQRIVEAHRGTIDIGDAPGGGAVFRIEIPQ